MVQVLKSASAPRLPDCFQKTPKKVTLTESGQILAVAVDCEGEGQRSIYKNSDICLLWNHHCSSATNVCGYRG